MSNPAKQRTEVAASTLELLHSEMVEYTTNDSKYSSHKEKAYTVLEDMGFKVGIRLGERLTRDKGRFADNLDTIKFICKDFWSECFKKNVDNLKTNHKGTYVLHDSKFTYLTRLSLSTPEETANAAKNHVVFSCGIIRGCLSSLGVEAFVTAEINALPSVLFKVIEISRQ
ncbi:trafficking protein particle complex subunit TRAPPC6B [Acrasis kona]|uniref:Trafficking protein particle complex subunit TRAPPC6B n=1 Tax=Acrasis kona TaxID=1008807 RepID=A0AAW2ZH74_9EUKA